MRIPTCSTLQTVLTATTVALAVYLFIFPLRSEAQGAQGQNAVCGSTSACSSSNTIGGLAHPSPRTLRRGWARDSRFENAIAASWVSS